MKTKVLKVDPDFPEREFIKEAAGILRRGGLVAFPTETVYGIGADYLNKTSMDRLYRIKKRPRTKPFTVHIAGFEALKELKIGLSGQAERIAHRFWPGPLTIVAFDREGRRIGLRMPRNKIASLVIAESSVLIAAPSANISGNKPPKSAGEVLNELGGSIDMVLDGGDTEIGIESTVLDVTSIPFTVLREGAVPGKELTAGWRVLFVCTGNSCRSVMAKWLFEKIIRDACFSGNISVDSAGTGGYSGIGATENTIEVMKEEGLDVSMHIGKGIDDGLITNSDVIFVMERSHKDVILNRFPDAWEKVRLLKEGEDIADPLGKSLEEYRHIKNIIKEQVQNIFLEFFKRTA